MDLMTVSGIHIHHLSKVFKERVALEDVTLGLPCNQMIALAGPDGSGKTTLVRLLAGLLRPTKGSIHIHGIDTVKQAAKLQASIGYMPQKFGAFEDLTVIQNLRLYADLKGVSPKERKQSFEKLLHFTQLEPFLDRLAGHLSGGMKQKLGLACALLSKPMLLLLDEPTVGVDPISRRELWDMVQELLKENMTVLWSTAYLDEAQKCSHVILLSEGKLLYHGKVDPLIDRVKERVFLVYPEKISLRKALSLCLNSKDVMDGVIQGDGLRILMKSPQQKLEEKDFSYQMAPVAPRFEDGFIDILGGGPGGVSTLAEKSPEISAPLDLMVKAVNLTKKFGMFTAVDSISFDVKKGEVFGLLGPNGAGKSTTFKMLCGLLKPTSGETFVGGQDLHKAKGSARKYLGYMAQKFSLYEGLSVYQNLKIFSGFYDLTAKTQKEMIAEMIEVFNFGRLVDETVSLIPLGFKQRLALACAVMHHPQVLFLDEPTSGIDPIMRREFWNHINGLVRKGTTVILTTHFMDEAENCDRIGLVYGGHLITIGTPQELKSLSVTEKNPHPTLEDAFIHLILQDKREKR